MKPAPEILDVAMGAVAAGAILAIAALSVGDGDDGFAAALAGPDDPTETLTTGWHWSEGVRHGIRVVDAAGDSLIAWPVLDGPEYGKWKARYVRFHRNSRNPHPPHHHAAMEKRHGNR